MAATKKTTKQTENKETTRRSLGINNPVTGAGLNDYFKLGESYTSLVLGIVVVIIASILLVSLFKTRPTPKKDAQQGTSSISTVANAPVTLNPTVLVTATPTPTVAQTKPTLTPKVTSVPEKPRAGSETYTIKPGDDLWHIAESKYHDGYKWTLIAQANKLDNPGLINAGNKLVLPVVSQTEKPSTQLGGPTATAPPGGSSITAKTYTVVHGDTLWDIAVRAYGNGYRWVEIAKANKLSNPELIHSGNILSIPRK
ncbi:MAG: LysM peptidoglycan-binding domain-containing protein [Patescibacteria group bacterium]